MRSPTRTRTLLPLLFLVACPEARAQYATSAPFASEVAAPNGVGMWTTGGPYGGESRALLIDPVSPTTVYTGGSEVFKSTDSGGTWAAATKGLVGGVFVLAASPTNPSTLFAGVSGGVFRSTDGGGTWVPVKASGSVFSLAVDPKNPSIVYAGTLGGGILKSTDSGSTWAAANSGLTNLSTYALAIDPVNSSTLYVGTAGGVFKSTNSGATWVAAITGLTNLSVVALAVDPVNPATVYAGTGGGVFKSANSGATWTVASTGLTYGSVRVLAINPLNPSTLYAGTTGGGVFRTVDGGATWVAMSAGLTNLSVWALAINPMTPTVLYAGTGAHGGVFKSTDSGSAWAPVDTALTNVAIYGLVVDPSTAGTVFAGGGGVFKSTNSGATWVVANTGLTTVYVHALAVDPVNAATLYAGTTGGGVFKSTNHGATWYNSGLTGPGIYALAVNPLTPTTLYAGTSTYPISDSGVYKSTDSGGSWAITALANQYVYALAVDPTTPAKVYAGTTVPGGTGGVYRSTDSGASWAPAVAGLPNLPVYALAVDPLTPTTLYAGLYTSTGDGVFRSTDSGTTWAPASAGLPNVPVLALAVDPVNPTTLYAGLYTSSGDGVFRSTDSGATWAAVGTGLTNLSVSALAINPSAAATLYAGTSGSVWQVTNVASSYPIAAHLLGSGDGTVMSSPAGINCGGVCTGNFAAGSRVTLSAVAAPGSVFTGWGGSCSGVGGCVLTADGPKAAKATFAANGGALAVAQPDGGEYVRGGSLGVVWTEGTAASFTLQLWKGAALHQAIAASVAGSSYVWAIPPFLPPATDYRIRVGGTSPSTESAMSGYFSIVSTATTGRLTGKVTRQATGAPIASASVTCGITSVSSGADGSYAFPSLTAGIQGCAASASGHATRPATIAVPSGGSVSHDFSLTSTGPAGSPRILSVDQLWPGEVYYLSGTSNRASVTADVDWAGLTPGSVGFRSALGTQTVTAQGNRVTHSFDAGTLPSCSTMNVTARSLSGVGSPSVRAPFAMMSRPYFIPSPITLKGFTLNDTSFSYRSEISFDIDAVDEGIAAGTIPADIPFFGALPFEAQLIPEVHAEITSAGEASAGLAFENIEAFNVKMAGVSFTAAPYLDVKGQWTPCDWRYSGRLGAKFSVSDEETWPFAIPAIPIPLFIAGYVKVEVDFALLVTDFAPPGATGAKPLLDGHPQFNPEVRGSVGAGLNRIISVEGWAGGGGASPSSTRRRQPSRTRRCS